MSAQIPRKQIEQTILLIRGHRVMLDVDLAELYGVETKAFNRAVQGTWNGSQMISCSDSTKRSMRI